MTKFLISIFILFLFSMFMVKADIDDDYDLLFNYTFESDYGPVSGNGSGTFSVSTASKYKGSYGFQASNSNIHLQAWWENNTFWINSSDFPIVVRGWFRDASGTADVPGILFPYNNSNHYESTAIFHSTTCWSRNLYYDGGDNYDQVEKTDDFTDNWFFYEANITNTTITSYAYQSENMDIYSDCYDDHTLFDTYGYIGFDCYNSCYWDDVEIWVGYNVTGGGGGGGGDTTSPTVSNINQSINNITVFNAVDLLNVSANITDDVLVNFSTINITLKLNYTYVYENGSLVTKNDTYSYSSNISDRFTFSIDETEYLSASYNINESYMEITPHSSFTHTGLNNWLKMEFLNISNQTNQNFVEAMYENATVTSCLTDYYYCNSEYTSGNPIGSQYCTLFFSGINNLGYNHSHGSSSKHKILPLGIDIATGQINDVEITETSYILKRGSQCSDYVYYINDTSRIGAMSTSNNNGNTYTDQTYTVDAHIHQIRQNSSLNYQICALDTSDNKGCSGWFGDMIEFPIFPPNAVTIYSPESLESYANTILINHSNSSSASGYSITGFRYEYTSNETTSWNLIRTNNYPYTNYTWDIANILNGAYKIRVIVTDSINQTTTVESDVFIIQQDLTIDQQYLASIDANVSLIYEVISMIPIVMLYLGLMGIGIWLIQQGSHLAGSLLWLNTIGIDFLLTALLWTSYIDDIGSSIAGRLTYMFLISLYLWIFLKIGALAFIRAKYKIRG